MIDVELIEKYLLGDIAAFNRLVWRWEKQIYNFSWRMCGDPEASKDICQKTFIRVYKSLKKLKDPLKFKTWLYQIAANLCRDEIRRRQKHITLSVENLQNAYEEGAMLPEKLISNPRNSPEFFLNQTNIREFIKKALDQIPEEQRIVIVMKEYQGLKFTEIAEILEQSVNTIKSRMYYGLSALRKVFEQWDIKKEALQYDL